MKYIKQITYVLVLIGALNWGVYGFFSIDMVNLIFGDLQVLARIIYVLVGLSAVYIILNKYIPHQSYCCAHSTDCKTCSIENNTDISAHKE